MDSVTSLRTGVNVTASLEMIESTKKVLTALSDTGLLLLQDKRLPNVVTIVTGETLKSSWWSHPEGRVIFSVLSEISEHSDVLFVKFLNKKVTLVHRQLWPALLALVSSAKPWQMKGLSKEAGRFLAAVNESEVPIVSSGPVVKELETRLLVQTQEVHGESGKHEVAVQGWVLWARRNNVKPLRSSVAASQEIERAIKCIGAGLSALPWPNKGAAT